MQTNITQVSPVEYELEIHATSDELQPEFQKALRAQQGRTQLKGFRQGRVPLNLVKKMYGKALAYEIADRTVQQTYEAQVLEGGTYSVLGQPKLVRLDYEMDGDLHATIRFGVRPAVELKDLSGETLPKLIHPVSEEDVERTLERLRREQADLVPVGEGEAIGASDHVTVDMQQLDEASGTPIIGKRDEDTQFFLDDERLHDDLQAALQGRQAGDRVRVELPHGHGDHVHTHLYEVTVKEVKRRELPELDDDFAKEATKGRLETADALREEIRTQLKREWEGESRELLEGMMVQRILELHPIPVPDSVVDTFLDYFVEDVKKRNDDKLPDGFDEFAFRHGNRDEAERQARWMILRDAFIEQEGIEVTDEAIDAYFEETVAGNDQISPAMLRQYYQSMNMLERVRQKLLSDLVHDRLQAKFNLVEMEREAFEADLKARAEAEAAGTAPAEVPPAEGA